MKNLVLSLFMSQIAFATAAKASANEFYIFQACEILGEVKIPGGCTATCEKRAGGGGNSVYKLTLSKGAAKTTLEVGMTERVPREILGDVLKISGGTKGQYPFIELLVNKDESLKSVSVNEIECK